MWPSQGIVPADTVLVRIMQALWQQLYYTNITQYVHLSYAALLYYHKIFVVIQAFARRYSHFVRSLSRAVPSFSAPTFSEFRSWSMTLLISVSILRKSGGKMVVEP